MFPGDHRVEVDLEQVRPLPAQLGEGGHEAGDGSQIDRRTATGLVKQPGTAQPPEHLLGDQRTDRGQLDGHVVERLGQDPAQADEDDRPELRIALEPNDELHAAGDLGLDEQAAQADLRPAADLEQLERRRADRSGVSQAEPDAADLGLVGDASWRRA